MKESRHWKEIIRGGRSKAKTKQQKNQEKGIGVNQTNWVYNFRIDQVFFDDIGSPRIVCGLFICKCG